MYLYCNYHKHSCYTNVRISDSATQLEDYAKRAQELGHGVLVSTEHGWQGNQWETINIARKYGLKPVICAEAYWVKDRTEQDRTNCHIIIAAKNENGRQALNDILSEANISGFYAQPRLDIPLILSLPADDVIVTTACIAFHRYDDVDDIILKFSNHFKDNFFLEVQPHHTESQCNLNKHLIDLHKKHNIKIIAGCDSHYIKPEDAQVRTDFLISKGISYPDEEGWFLDYPDGDTLYNRFANQCVLTHDEIVEAINNTNIFLEVEEYNPVLFDTSIKMPTLYPDWTQEERNNEYKRLVYKGWDNYKHNVPEDKWDYYIEEIEKETQTVIDTNMADYFIINHHIINQGKENGGWLTKSGRGSAVSFFTNMLLGFTEVDRISAKVHMYPERFMSTTRILQSGSLPDIDFNVAPVAPFAKAQQQVLGEDHAYPMISYGTMQKSAAWKLYAKSQGIVFEIANAISEQIKKYEIAKKHADEDAKDDIDVFDYIDKEYHEIYEKSKDYLGLITSWSIAPCSYLLYQGSIRKDFGLVKIKDHLCCTMDGHYAEACHFLKNDLLKVSVVDLIYQSYHTAGLEPPVVKELLDMCPPDDAVWDIYAKGCTIGINQVEQTGTSSRVAQYKPKNISELGAFVAAIRPGFKSMYKIFESREPFAYNIKAFDELMQTDEMPNSFLLYQEQEMAALNYAGIDMSDCYTAIKNIAKKRVDKVLAYKEAFVNGFSNVMINDENKTPEEANELALKLWQIIEDSSRYSFNASHSYCVALDSLYGAWLKAHHPLEFYATYLRIQEEKGDKDKMNAAKAEAEDYFNIKFPMLKFGQDNRTITADKETNSITNSLSSIKGFGNDVGNALYECSQQGFTNFIDILDWLDQRSIKSAKLKPLIQIDYFSDYGNSRQLTMIIDAWDILNQGKRKLIRKDKEIPEDLLQVIALHSTTQNSNGKESASYKIIDSARAIIDDYARNIIENETEDYDIKTKMQNSQNVLGYINVITNKEVDKRRLLVTDCVAINGYGDNIWAYRVGTRSLGSGKTARLTVKADIYKKQQFKPGDVIYASEVWKNKQGYWYLQGYQIEK